MLRGCLFSTCVSFSLMLFVYFFLQTTLPISLQLEVAVQHHLFMIGRGGSNLQHLMAKTGANICFPDLSSSMVTPPNKGIIYISGTVDSVLSGREHLIVRTLYHLPTDGPIPVLVSFTLMSRVYPPPCTRLASYPLVTDTRLLT